MAKAPKHLPSSLKKVEKSEAKSLPKFVRLLSRKGIGWQSEQ